MEPISSKGGRSNIMQVLLLLENAKEPLTIPVMQEILYGEYGHNYAFNTIKSSVFVIGDYKPLKYVSSNRNTGGGVGYYFADVVPQNVVEKWK